MRHFRASLVVILAFVLVGSLFLLNGCAKKEPETIKIGAILPLTGPGALWGNNTRKGAEIAVDEINKAGGINNKKLVLISEDSKGEAKEGVTVIQKLINIDKVNAILDDAVSSVALAIVPIITENKLPTISTGSSNPKLSGSSPYFFRLWNSDIEEAVISAKFIATEKKLNEGVILYIRNEYGDGLQIAFEKEFAKYGGRILGKESFEPGAASFREQLLKLKALNPQFVYLIGYPVEIPRVLVEMKKQKFDVQVVTTAAIEDKSVIEQAKVAADGVIYPYPKPAQTKITESFKQTYKQKYGEDPGSPAAEAYDAVMLFAETFKKVGVDRQKVRDFISSIRHEGASGLIEFDKNGDVHKPMEMKIIKAGKFELYK
ncbi:MAG: ABC transporter substrate-binding protein [Nitrospirota bacterium]